MLDYKTEYDKLGAIFCSSEFAAAYSMVETFRRHKVAVDWYPSVSIKAQLSYCKRKGFGQDLIFIEKDRFLYQDCREYAPWIMETCEEMGKPITLFEKIPYKLTEGDVVRCIEENLVTVSIS